MKPYSSVSFWTVLALFVVALPTALIAQEEDQSGTNPIAFTFDFRMYAEAKSSEGDNSSETYTFEHRVPIGKVQLRMRNRIVNSTVATPGGPVSISGFGDSDARLLYVPHMKGKFAVATGLEGFFDTASQPAFGSGQTMLGPQVFGVFFGLFGPQTLVAPAYQYVFDIAGEGDTSRSLVDIFMLYLAPSKKYWAMLNPQFIFDHENNREWSQIDVEVGAMMFGPISNYVRPSVGVGNDRTYNWSLELGLKFIWR